MQRTKDFLNRFNPNARARRDYRINRQKDDLLQNVKDKFGINVFCPNNYTAIIKEVFFEEIYNLDKYIKLKEHVVLDIGMNRGYASLYFAQNPLCKKVYGFEPCKETFEIALKNFEINPKIREKIIAHDFGLSYKMEKKTLYYNENRDGVSSISKQFIEYYTNQDITNFKKEEICLQRASDVIAQILNENQEDEIILKIDVEGAEYEIIPDLFSANLLKKVNIIIGDLHIVENKQETRNLFEYFYNSGFRPILLDEKETTIGFLFERKIF